jgi:putative flavoprotein involved in K+ transport
VDDVVIVGAGPAGLAAAAALRIHGLDATILERGEHVGEQWRTRYDRLHLHTIRWLSNLPGYRIPREFGRWVARDQFVQYLEQYAAHHRLEPRFGVEATRIDRDDGRWCVQTTAGMVWRGSSWWPAAIHVCHICRNGRVRSKDRWSIPRITGIRDRIAARTC